MLRRANPEGAPVLSVRTRSAGARAGLQPGDRLLAINGHPLRDLIDFRFYSDEPVLHLTVDRAGLRLRLTVQSDSEQGLGVELDGVLYDGLRTCANRCPFCFVEQMPSGMRPALYVHDDDYRLSFLQGSFVTLTNLREEDWARLAAQRLSPLYVSIHATDLDLRRRMLGNPHAPDILAQIRRLGEMRIRIHGQVVIVPGENDGAALERTIVDLVGLWPAVQTLALVPVGVTDFCTAPLRPLTVAEAQSVLETVRRHRRRIRAVTGRTWLYPADELYLLAGVTVPSSRFYDDPGQQENGAGLVRLLLDDWQTVVRRIERGGKRPRRLTFACGTLIAPLLNLLVEQWRRLEGWDVMVVPVPNKTFGQTVTVSGLLTGRDVINALAPVPLGEAVFLPRAMFDVSQTVTLDDITVGDIQGRLGVPVHVAGSMSEVWRALA